MNKALFLLVIPAFTLTSGAAFAQGEWYVEPSIAYVDDDPDRVVGDGLNGLQIKMGRELNNYLTVEGLLGYNSWDGWKVENVEEFPDQTLIDLSANLLWSPDRDWDFMPYLIGGIGYLFNDVKGFGSDNNASATYGIGFKWALGDSGRFSLRGEARQRVAFDSEDSNPWGDGALTDSIVSLGLQYNYGGASSARAAPDDTDTDRDGVLDIWDDCPNTPPGTEVGANGCPIIARGADSDGDRIVDSQDECPETPFGVPVNEFGCPLDSDFDGVPTDRDRCPSTRPGVAVDIYGCEVDTDLDNDGVLNDVDSCPATPEGVRVDIYGCEITDIIQLPGVNFETDSEILLPGAERVLIDAAATLKIHSDLIVEVAGHTDNVGNENWNIGLSLRRAYVVRDFLIANGVDPDRVTARGYGESQPIADNGTADGRSMNRRVELRIISSD